MDEIIYQVKKWLDEGKQAAIAIVVAKKGSAMRPVGAKLAICADGSLQGSVSGGCVESAVIEEAQACMHSGQPKLLHYGVSDDTAWSVGLMCGGEIDILVLPIIDSGEKSFDRIIIDKIAALEDKRQAFMLLIQLSEMRFGQTCILENGSGKIDPHAAAWVERDAIPQLQEMARTETSGILTMKTGRVYVDVGNPAPRLVILGAVHTAIALVDMAKKIGIYTIVIDPRKAFATRERFPQVDELLTDWPEECFNKIGLNSEDYVLLMTHDDKIDLPAAGAALSAKVKYIGMLASRITRERRFQLLVEDGFDKEQVEKIHAPVGLKIGARTPEEIALSVLAEITAFRYGKV
jgi:xanthine dehydrogenase accessory factor